MPITRQVLLTILFRRPELKLLPSDQGLVHEARFRQGEHRHPILIGHIRRSTQGYCYSRNLGHKFKFFLFKLFHSLLVFKEYHFAIRLSSKLKSYCYLGHINLANDLIVLKDNI